MAVVPHALATGLTAGAAEYADELAHTTGDSLVDLVEHFAALVHRIANRARLDRRRVEVAQEDHIARPTPEAFTHETTLNRVHCHDEIGSADHIGCREARPMFGKVHGVTGRCSHGLGGRFDFDF